MSETIDKRIFLAGFDCHTRGWFAQRMEKEALSRGLSWRFHMGAEIGRAAREWLGPGRLLPTAPEEIAIAKTQQALSDPGGGILFEASFRSGAMVARADALKRDADGWRLIEVKSGSAPEPGKLVSDDYRDDIAYTASVAQKAGLKVGALSLVLLNRAYRLGGPAPQFMEVDVTAQAMPRVAEFQAHSTEIGARVTAPDKPKPIYQFGCKGCPFFATSCLGVGIPDPLFTLPRLSAAKFAEWREYLRLSDLPETVKLTDNQRQVWTVIRSGTPHIDPAELALMDEVAYPVHYLDFEAVSPPVPWFVDSPPYQAEPFQYSLHIRDTPDSPEEHVAYLAPSEGDWRRDLIVQLLEHLGDKGSIVVYSSYEKTRLNALSMLFPDLSDPIAAIVDRLFDLENVIKHGYIHPDFGGRTSIKKVLPVVAPDLTYKGLAITNGEDAAGSFGLMRVGQIPLAQHKAEREALLKYCHLDTLAMLRLHEALLKLR